MSNYRKLELITLAYSKIVGHDVETIDIPASAFTYLMQIDERELVRPFVMEDVYKGKSLGYIMRAWKVSESYAKMAMSKKFTKPQY